MDKNLPFDLDLIERISEDYPTPFYVYDEKAIKQAAQTIRQAFSWNRGFKNYFAVKALPNPRILKILIDQGMGLDCSSLTELLLAERVQASGQDIMFSSNDTA